MTGAVTNSDVHFQLDVQVAAGQAARHLVRVAGSLCPAAGPDVLLQDQKCNLVRAD